MIKALTRFYSTNKTVLGIITIGALLRIIYINWGLPEVYEEATPLDIARKFWGSGNSGFDFNPHFFNYPALTFYLHFIIQALHYGIGHAVGVYANVSSFLAESSPLVITARAFTALLDVGTIYALYLLAQQVAGNRVALIAAAFAALNPLHIQQAHLIQVDTALTLFSVMAMYYVIKSLEQPSRYHYVVAGVCIGAAAASKYTGAFLIIVLLIAFFLRIGSFKKLRHRWKDNNLFFGIIASAITFIIFNPYIILSFNEFEADLAFERYHVSYGHLGVVSTQSTIGYYLLDVLSNHLGWLLYAAVLIGGVFIVKQKEKKNLLLISYPIIYLIILSSWEMRAERYILPIIPILLLIGAIGVSSLWDQFFKSIKRSNNKTFESRTSRVALASIAGVLLLAQPVAHNYSYLRTLGLPDTRTVTKQWIAEHLKPGASIASGPYGIDFPEQQYKTVHIPFLAFQSELVAPFYDARWYEDVDLLITSDYDYGRYTGEPERYKEFLPYYDSIKASWKLMYEIAPGEDYAGPRFWLYRFPDSLKRAGFEQSMFERFRTNPESARISNFLKELNAVLLQKSQWLKSEQVLKEILSVEVGNLPLRNQLCAMLVQTGKYNEALMQLQRSAQMNPNQPIVFALAGRCLLRLNKLMEAEATLVKALNTDRSIVHAYDDLIEVYTLLKDNKKLAFALEQYAALYPANSAKGKALRERLEMVSRGTQ